MTYVSTRAGAGAGAGAGSARLSFREVVFAGLAPDGGLYVPAGGAAAFPRLPAGALRAWRALPYFEVAFRVLSLFVGPDQVPAEDLRALCRRSYGAGTQADRAGWAVAAVAPLVAVPLPGAAAQGAGAGAGTAPPRLLVAEHFHGPTCAFKDLALQFVGNLFEWLLEREAREAREESSSSGGSGASGPPRRLLVLGATSGDTGSAAIAGLRGKRGVDTVILHPAGRVAAVQALQMTTVLDASVHNVAVSGATFDDCQAAVKAAFVDPAFRARHRLTAINSINWARILAQVCYSVWSYIRFLEVKDAEAVAAGNGAGVGASAILPEATFIVPSGNMGNALSVLYARRLGVPLARVAVATNENDVLHRLISAGDFARAPAGVAGTLAPSMDIAAPSNLERYVFEAAEAADGAAGAAALVRAWVAASPGAAQPTWLRAALARDFVSARASDAHIDAAIRAFLAGADGGYALCPHSACGAHAALTVPELAAACARGDAVLFATAHPGKFAAATPALREAGLFLRDVLGEGAAQAREVRPALPPQLRGLSGRPSRCVALASADAAGVMALADALVAGAR
jgi:threonine synthase